MWINDAIQQFNVYWLTEFGTVLRNHGGESSPQVSKQTMLGFINTVENLGDTIISGVPTQEMWNEQNKTATESGLTYVCEPMVPDRFRSYIRGAQLYSWGEDEQTEREEFLDTNCATGTPWGVWQYNRHTKGWEPFNSVETFDDGDSVASFGLLDVYNAGKQINGVDPIIFSYSCRHLEIVNDTSPANPFIPQRDLTSEKAWDASLQRRIVYRRNEIEQLCEDHIILNEDLLEAIIHEMINTMYGARFEFNLSDWAFRGKYKAIALLAHYRISHSLFPELTGTGTGTGTGLAPDPFLSHSQHCDNGDGKCTVSGGRRRKSTGKRKRRKRKRRKTKRRKS